MGVPYAEVIGNPIAHSKSPIIHKFWLEKLGKRGDYRRTRVTTGELPDFLASRRQDPDWRGCNVTIPHKEAAAALVDRTTPEAERSGAVNAVVATGDSLLGDNTDYHALREELLGWADESALLGQPAVVIGAGGAARAVLCVLQEVQDLDVVLINRSEAKALALIREFGLRGHVLPLGAPLPNAGLVVNASSLGMSGYPDLPVDLSKTEGATIVDMVYSPVETDLLRQAKERGLVTVDGLALLIGQARLAFRHFFRLAPPFGTEQELRELLTR